ncbi:hypothetical protein L226DRAFT_292586 [Lentinus tigrinus ALCF2SS1-7]|uniref:uncharacterized protein n=1 Tax=Lentinus tigrinus ALCF2SS1-7 TaxID=1328758 RepID=UPI00116633F4|nr:hypothetical protein L226DRAFT_292586 [Lentinus tigrinus ALCF2SS1-7]
MQVQTTRCATRQTAGRPACFVCKGGSAGRGDSCRFKDFRRLEKVGKETWRSDFSSQDLSSAPGINPPTTFNAEPSLADIRELQTGLVPFMRPLLTEMLAHESLPNVIRRQPDPRYRLTCGAFLRSHDDVRSPELAQIIAPQPFCPAPFSAWGADLRYAAAAKPSMAPSSDSTAAMLPPSKAHTPFALCVGCRPAG